MSQADPRPAAAVLIIIIVATFTFLLQVTDARAQPFQQVGDASLRNGIPDAGRLNRIVPILGMGGSTIFVGTTDGGVWRTTDGGGTWLPLTDFASSLRITALDADATGTRVFAATQWPTRLLRSLDGGNTFMEIVIPVVAWNTDTIGQLLVDPLHANTVYARSTRGLLRSTDNGSTWSVVLPPDTRHVADSAILSGGEFWILAARREQLYRSPDGEAGSFQPVSLPPPNDGQTPFPNSYALLNLMPVPGQPQRIFIAYGTQGGAVYVSNAYGAAAAFVSRITLFLNHGVAAASADGQTLYGGGNNAPIGYLFRGRDSGQNWDTPFTGPYHPDILGLTTTASPSRLWVGTDGGLWRLTEGTQIWQNLNGNLGNLHLHAVHTLRPNPNVILGGTQDNGTITWQGTVWKQGHSPGDTGEGYLRRDDPDRGGMYNCPFGGCSGGLLRYVTGDAQSTYPSDPAKPHGGFEFATDPSHPIRTCVTALGRVRCTLDGWSDNWPQMSPDIGARWLAMASSTHIWVATAGGEILRTSTGVAGPWTDVTSNLPAGGVYGLEVPEGGDPDHALVLKGSQADPPKVWETTNGGAIWVQIGVPPVPNPGGLPSLCLTVPCPNIPESGPQVQRFGVTFPKFFRPEIWYVGTSHGLLESSDRGQTWNSPTWFPHVDVRDIDTHGRFATIGTWGRGVWQRIHDTADPSGRFLDYDFFWRFKHSPFFMDDQRASVLLALGGDQNAEIRSPRGGGRAFRRGDQAFGPHDFLLQPGQPFLLKADASGRMLLEGEQAVAEPVALSPGWNAVAVVDALLGSASDLAADAASQGVVIGAVLDGEQQRAWVPGGPGGPAGVLGTASTDFPLDPTEGYWVFACGSGGIWTPGAGGSGASPLGLAPATSGLVTCNAGAAAELPDLLENLTERIPSEFFACLPEGTASAAIGPIAICDTPPGALTDQDRDYAVCQDMPLSRGCALTLHILDIMETGTGTLEVRFDSSTDGTATLPDGTTCAVNAMTDDALFLAQVVQSLDGPVVQLSMADGSVAAGLTLEQSGCGPAADAAIAAEVAAAVEQALVQEIEARVTGLGPVCAPSFAIPDADGDGAADCNDGCPLDPGKTDPGQCGCGVVDDADGDGAAGCGGDCDDADGLIWAVPGEVPLLTLARDSASTGTLASWTAPVDPGGLVVVYDLLSSQDPADFTTSQCVESDGTDTSALLSEALTPGAIRSILVRAENVCPGGTGSLGTDSSGVQRVGRLCP